MNFLESGIPQLSFTVSKSHLSCDFCTETSASFILKMNNQRGWVDVHFPCHGHIKVQMRGRLPRECIDPIAVRELVEGILHHLKIPSDETYEALFFAATNLITVAQPVDREGKTDRIVSTTKWELPK